MRKTYPPHSQPTSPLCPSPWGSGPGVPPRPGLSGSGPGGPPWPGLQGSGAGGGQGEREYNPVGTLAGIPNSRKSLGLKPSTTRMELASKRSKAEERPDLWTWGLLGSKLGAESKFDSPEA